MHRTQLGKPRGYISKEIESNSSTASPRGPQELELQKRGGFMSSMSRLLSFTDKDSDDGSSDYNSFDEDLERLESGESREVIYKEILQPTSFEHRWNQCRVVRLSKKTFKLYADDSKNGPFMLSAKWVNERIYVSQYENFAGLEGTDPSFRSCAVVRLMGDRSFRVLSRSCEACDDVLDKYTCGGLEDEDGGRQILADVKHHLVRAGDVLDMRTFSATLPSLEDDKSSRVVWCRRGHWGSTKSNAESNAALSSPGGSLSRVKPQRRSLCALPTPDPGMRIESAKPVVNKELGSLVLKFVGGRVRKASAKNFIMKTVPEDSSAINSEASRHVLQFGRMDAPKSYAMDYRWPMSPMQAFGIVLSTFAWKDY